MAETELASVLADHGSELDEDSSSEMDVSASSRSPTPEVLSQLPPHVGAKRKLSGSDDTTTINNPMQAYEDSAKKRKLSTPPAPDLSGPWTDGLPVELWQQVFLYLPPAMLCRCLRVCRNFHNYLTQTKASAMMKKGKSRVRVLDSETIWTHARKVFFPNLPRPLTRCTELEMLQLVGGRTCQFCTREPIPSPATTTFNCGPGPDGLRVTWPFGIRACGRCIENNTLKASIAALRRRVATNALSGRPDPRLGGGYSPIRPTIHISYTRPTLRTRDPTADAWRHTFTPSCC